MLLKNATGVLPLAKTGGKIFVAGKSADDIGNQCGGWTIDWQGSRAAITPGTTILQGIRSAVGSGHHGRLRAATAPASTASYRRPSRSSARPRTPRARATGRNGSRPRRRPTWRPLARLRASGVPVIVVLVSGRPLDIAGEVDGWNALVAAWLPGTEGAGCRRRAVRRLRADRASCR